MRPAERDDLFYDFLAGEARSALLKSALKVGLPALLAERGPLSGPAIVSALGLHPERGRKWLLLLRYVRLIEETAGRRGGPRYAAAPLLQALFGDDGRSGYFYRDFLRYWEASTRLDLVDVLHGKPVPDPVRYPPVTAEDTWLLHAWMRETARETFGKLKKHVDFGKTGRLLDVAGGDATMALEIVARHPGIRVTVFNLPAAAALARENVAQAGARERISIVEGNFFTDRLPAGFDAVMFSRVLADWPAETCRMLLRKAHRALAPGGRLIICEPLTDANPALAIAWEHSYLPYDDFGYQVYKPLAVYRRLLRDSGFTRLQAYPRDKDSVHSVLVARRV
jgi:SAM-dependent methyltransferase